MKSRFLIAAFGLAVCSLGAQAANVGVSINIGDPNFYGRVDIGRVPSPPVLVYEQPVVIVRPRVQQQPIYLRVPPGHEKHWDKHCNKYNACGQPVYFVRDSWYREQYVRQERREDRREDRREERREDRRDDRGDHGRGHGNGHGHGHGHNKD